MMLEVGSTYDLEIVKDMDFGVYLDAENLGEVLLPNRFVPEDAGVGDSVRVFICHDSEDRLIATTQRPRIQAGQFAYLEVVDTTPFGAFLDWGLDKHLLVPFAEQHRNMAVGKSYLVHAYVDKRDGRMVASSKLEKFLEDEASHQFKPRQAVNLIIANSTELGFKAIINHTHWGLLHKEDVFQRLSFGQSIKGFIQKIRPDGRINLTLNGGRQSLDKNSAMVINYMKKHDGYAPLHDKSDPQDISSALGISKAAFKKAIGSLYKQRIIRIEDGGIRMVASDE